MLDDSRYLLDMLLVARDLRDVAREMSREALAVSVRDQWALTKGVELIGEAASRVSQATRDAHPGIPWRQIVGMRHRLVHDYQNLDLDILWSVVQSEIPPLIAQLEAIVPPEDE